jgi:hypothetical protein
MRRNVPIAAVAWLLCVAPGHAQFSIYATSTNIHASNVESGTSSTQTTVQPIDTSYWASGIGGGATFNLLPLHVVSLGLDARGSTRPGTSGADTALVGLKLAVHPPLLKVKPYIQGSVGYLGTRTVDASTATIYPPEGQGPIVESVSPAGQTDTHHFLTYGVLGGVDFPLVPFLDFRVEAGYLHGNDLGRVLLGGAALPNPNIVMFNPGLVLHF